MQVLIVKTSSLGDVIHTLPALTDARDHYPTIQFDWAIEPSFAEVPTWHPAVQQVIPIAWRAWRKHPIAAWQRGEITSAWQQLRQKKYDYIIDAQGLVKSAFITAMARGIRCGFNYRTAREPLAALAYQRQFTNHQQHHAVTRTRQLFADALEYTLPNSPPDYGISQASFKSSLPYQNYLVFLHGTTWSSKLWPESYWQALAKLAGAAGFNILVPWGNEREFQRASAIASAHPQVSILPKANLGELAAILAAAKAVVAVDTGLGHLAAALAIPTLTLYGPTNPQKVGTFGLNQHHLLAEFECVPCQRKQCHYRLASSVNPACFSTLTPDRVWHYINSNLVSSNLVNPNLVGSSLL